MIGFTLNRYSTNASIGVQGTNDTQYIFSIPSSGYIPLPAVSTPFLPAIGDTKTFYAYSAANATVPVNALANLTTTFSSNQSYALVYIAQSSPDIYDEETGGNTLTATFPTPQILLFEELPSDRDLQGSYVKIVNIAVSTYPAGLLRASLTYYGDFNIPFGGSTDFIGAYAGDVLNVTLYLPNVTRTIQIYPSSDTSTIVYVRGDIGGQIQFAYDSSVVYFGEPSTPVTTPVAAPIASSPSSWPRVRFLNAADMGTYNTLMVYSSSNISIYNITTNYLSDYQYLDLSPGGYQFQLLYNDMSPRRYFNLQAGASLTFFSNVQWGLSAVFDLPNFYVDQRSSYVQVVHLVNATSDVTLSTSAGTWQQPLENGWILWWKESSGWSEISATINGVTQYDNYYLANGTATTIFIVGTPDNFYFVMDAQPFPAPDHPFCSNGYLESNGVCNCYSGYYTDNSLSYKCSLSAPSYCSWNNQTDALSNDFIPYINWWNNAQVYGDQLYFSIASDLVSGRRTLIELPNSQCNFLNQPMYYQKHSMGCMDVIDVQIPFVNCGFTKISTPYEDFYKGTVNVRQIDQITVGGIPIERVIDTPFPISIRMPKQLAVQSFLQVSGPPSLAIDAAFVGQTVSPDTRSGNLQYVSAVQYPLEIGTVELVDLPYGVYAWVEVVNVNCSDVGPCVQRLEIHINTTECYISGTYRMVVSLSCRSDQGCPEEAKNGTQAYIESRIVSQSLCGEVGIDIDLNGYIQAYTDNTFSSLALAFYPGQSAYFVINAVSSRVSLSKVTLDTVYYYGPNINFQYLFYNGNQTDIAVSSNFVTGSMGNTQAWFGLDVSVSTPQSGENTLFKLYQGQNGVYNFVAIVDVEWFVADSTSPVTSNQPTFKKRMALQGSLSNQGAQFTAQVQIAGPTPLPQQPPQQEHQPPVAVSKPSTGPVSSGTSLLVTWLLVGPTMFAML